MSSLVALALVLVVSALLWGVGTMVQTLVNAPHSGGPTALGTGLATWIFLGGILNAIHLATAISIVLLLILSAFAAAWAYGHQRVGARRSWVTLVPAITWIVAVTLFAVSTQLSPKVFNFHDDFQKYLAYPVRMLATGTLGGSTLSALGQDTLGGQAFLHALVLACWPLRYVNGVDAVFGLFLIMALGATASRTATRTTLSALAGAVLIAIVDPQYVNISGLYIGALLVGTATLVTCQSESDAPSPAILGLVYAAAIAVKPTLAIFAILHLPLVTWAMAGVLPNIKTRVVWCLRVGVWTTLGLLPWLAIWIPNYVAKTTLPQWEPPFIALRSHSILSVHPTAYGAPPVLYSLLVAAALICAVARYRTSRGADDARHMQRDRGLFAAALAGACCYILFVPVMGDHINGFDGNIRFTIPILLGSSALVLAATLQESVATSRRGAQLLAWAACIGLIVGFLPAAAMRTTQALRTGSILAFSRLASLPEYKAGIDYWLSEEAQMRVSHLQQQVPAGEALIAWIGSPYLLDYKRNRIIDVDTAGIATPWARLPPQVSYVLWQYRGFGIRTDADYQQVMHEPGAHERHVAARSLTFLNYIDRLATQSQILARDDQFALLKLRP